MAVCVSKYALDERVLATMFIGSSRWKPAVVTELRHTSDGLKVYRVLFDGESVSTVRHETELRKAREE